MWSCCLLARSCRCVAGAADISWGRVCLCRVHQGHLHADKRHQRSASCVCLLHLPAACLASSLPTTSLPGAAAPASASRQWTGFAFLPAAAWHAEPLVILPWPACVLYATLPALKQASLCTLTAHVRMHHIASLGCRATAAPMPSGVWRCGRGRPGCGRRTHTQWPPVCTPCCTGGTWRWSGCGTAVQVNRAGAACVPVCLPCWLLLGTQRRGGATGEAFCVVPLLGMVQKRR